jgi:predicted O-methyltransferase YrrM
VSETIKRLLRFLRSNGIRATLLRCGAELRGFFWVGYLVHSRQRFNGIDELLDFSFGNRAASIRPSQLRVEIEPVLRLVYSLQVRTVLEIGTFNGGTLFLWTRVAAEDAEIISLDLPGGRFGGGYPVWRRPFYRDFALPQQRIHLLQSDSHDPKSLDRVKALLGSRRLDLLMIDGDHSYVGVKRDFEMYGSLVRPGGLIVFHDIAQHIDRDCEVRKYWLEVSQTLPAQEFVASPPQGWAGIGVLEQR